MAKINDTTTYPNTAPALTDHVPGTDVSNTANDANGETVTFTLQAILDLVEANGAAPASFLASGTLADARVAASNVTQHQAALSITESQISDLGTYLTDVVGDTTPQLGGNLDVNGNSIVSTANGNITIAPNGTGNVVLGNYTLDADATVGAGQDGYVLKYTHSNGTWAPAVDSGAGGGISNVVEDTTPQLGGDLDLNDKAVCFVGSNTTGSQIDKGTPVYINGASNSIAPADSDGSGTMPCVGIAAEDIANSASGLVAVLGTVSGINTSTFTADDTLYVSATAGALTNTIPATGKVQPIARVITVNDSTGTIFVSVFQAGTELANLTNTTTTVGGDLMLFADASASNVPIARTVTNFLADHSLFATGGTDLAVADGGTGASDAATARTNLGAAALSANVFTGTQDFNGQQVEGFANKVVTSVTGALTMADHSGNVLKTSGNITVPTTAGFNAVIIAGGAHTVTFNATTSAAMATGDVMTVVVESGTVIHAVLTAAADKVSFT